MATEALHARTESIKSKPITPLCLIQTQWKLGFDLLGGVLGLSAPITAPRISIPIPLSQSFLAVMACVIFIYLWRHPYMEKPGVMLPGEPQRRFAGRATGDAGAAARGKAGTGTSSGSGSRNDLSSKNN